MVLAFCVDLATNEGTKSLTVFQIFKEFSLFCCFSGPFKVRTFGLVLSQKWRIKPNQLISAVKTMLSSST